MVVPSALRVIRLKPGRRVMLELIVDDLIVFSCKLFRVYIEICSFTVLCVGQTFT